MSRKSIINYVIFRNTVYRLIWWNQSSFTSVRTILKLYWHSIPALEKVHLCVNKLQIKISPNLRDHHWQYSLYVSWICSENLQTSSVVLLFYFFWLFQKMKIFIIFSSSCKSLNVFPNISLFDTFFKIFHATCMRYIFIYKCMNKCTYLLHYINLSSL